MMTMNLSVADVAQRKLLAGAAAGEGVRPLLEEAVRGFPSETLLILDFGQVELATSSYFLAAFGWIWTSASTGRDLFPVLANVNRESRDEMEVALRMKGLRALFATYANGQLTDVQPFNLDKADEETYRLLDAFGEATASDLFRADPLIQPTGWSNRLALLYAYRLVRRRKQGRQLFYALSWR